MAVLRSIGRGRTSQSAADETADTHWIADFDAPLTPGEKVHVLRRRLIKQRRSSSASKSLQRRIRWTFGALVVAPVVVTLTYLNLFATPQYYASVGFTVRSLESSPPEDLLTGFTGVTTARSKTENDIIFRYLESGEIVDSIESRLAIKDHYSRSWVQDPIFLFPANGSFEQLVRYWQRSLDISYDPTSGLFDLRVRARSPEWAVVIAQELLRLVDGKVEELSRSAFKDAVRHIAGNCHTDRDSDTGILVHRYGPHIFHTDIKDVWDFVGRFADFVPYRHRVKTTAKGQVFSLPINLHTINQVFESALGPDEALLRIASGETVQVDNDFETRGRRLVGDTLFELFFAGYMPRVGWSWLPQEMTLSRFFRFPKEASSISGTKFWIHSSHVFNRSAPLTRSKSMATFSWSQRVRMTGLP